jgi:enoyl-CoA hydratase/carnithine racemase
MSEAIEDQIRVGEEDGILTVTFTRDRKLNAVHDDMIEVLREAVAQVGREDTLRALVITGEGRYFTAGRDISQMGNGFTSGVALRYHYRQVHELFDELEKIEKPVVLAAQGPCLGMGVEMASSCDFRFASPAAVFGLPELSNLAILPGSGGISRFTRIVGAHWARWVAMAGETLTAEEALRIGFVHRIMSLESFHADVHDWVKKLTDHSGEALGLAKIAIDAAATADRRVARQIDRIANTQLLASQEHLEKIDAFTTRLKS